MTYITCLFLWTVTAAAAADFVDVRVQLYDNTGVAPGIREKAQQVAGEILDRAGVRLRWELCGMHCRDDSGGTVLVVGLAGPQVKMPAPAVLGMAMLGAGMGNRAVISVPRVKWFSDMTLTPIEMVMGHAIAHEIGHLLLHSKEHSSGLMVAKWGKECALKMRQGNLHFTPEDAEEMRRNLETGVTMTALKLPEKQ